MTQDYYLRKYKINIEYWGINITTNQLFLLTCIIFVIIIFTSFISFSVYTPIPNMYYYLYEYSQ